MVFVQDFQLINQAYDAVAGRLRADPGAVLCDAFEAARAEAHRLRTQVGSSTWPAVIPQNTTVRPGPLRDLGDSVLVAFGWDAGSTPGLLTHLDADVDVAPFGSCGTWVTLRARYTLNRGQGASAADQLMILRMAESTVRAFLIRACVVLENGRTAGDATPSHAGGR